MAKFQHCEFSEGSVCFNAKRYSQEQALEITAREYFECQINELLCHKSYVYYGYGVDVDGTPHSAYWLHDTPCKNGFEVWQVERRNK